MRRMSSPPWDAALGCRLFFLPVSLLASYLPSSKACNKVRNSHNPAGRSPLLTPVSLLVDVLSCMNYSQLSAQNPIKPAGTCSPATTRFTVGRCFNVDELPSRMWRISGGAAGRRPSASHPFHCWSGRTVDECSTLSCSFLQVCSKTPLFPPLDVRDMLFRKPHPLHVGAHRCCRKEVGCTLFSLS